MLRATPGRGECGRGARTIWCTEGGLSWKWRCMSVSAGGRPWTRVSASMKAKYCPCLAVKLFADIATRSIHLRLSRRRGKMNIRYRVELSEAERSELGSLLRGGQHAARKLKRAQILLAADAGVPDETIAQSLGVGGSTVYRTKRHFVEGTLGKALLEESRPGARRSSARSTPSRSGRFGGKGGSREFTDRTGEIGITLKGGAAKAAVTKLLGLGFVKEVPVKRGAPAWRTDQEEKPLGLKLTKAGSAALGLAEDGASEEEAAPQPKTRRKPKKHAPGEDQTSREPRAGSKQAQIIALMQRKSGASLAAMVEATGWLPHTTRAALTGASAEPAGHQSNARFARQGTCVRRATRSSETRARKARRSTACRPEPAVKRPHWTRRCGSLL